ncbi:hypothetical protein [Piscinibacter sakaiensis]|uniref:hypothetical protein n=1 Tax=Piscinibacter sakaiensis TaxID=1547922 RepID=UPI003AAC9DD9
MNTKTIVAGLAFGFVATNALAVEASRVEVPVTSLQRAEIRAEIVRTPEAVGAFSATEAYGSFSGAMLHKMGSLSRADVVAEMALPHWQALIAAKSSTYNDFRGTSPSEAPLGTTLAIHIQPRDFVGG